MTPQNDSSSKFRPKRCLPLQSHIDQAEPLLRLRGSKKPPNPNVDGELAASYERLPLRPWTMSHEESRALDSERSPKRQRLDDKPAIVDDVASDRTPRSSSNLNYIDLTRRSISPPATRAAKISTPDQLTSYFSDPIPHPKSPPPGPKSTNPYSDQKCIPSPVQLSTVNELPAAYNVDTVSLGDILGNPLIKECWLFNYLFDVDFVM